MTPFLLAAALTIGPPTMENLGVLHRDQADQYYADQHIDPTWFLADGWATMPDLTPVRVPTQHPPVPRETGPGSVTPPPAELADMVRAKAAAYGWDQGPDWDALVVLLWKESGWRPEAQNPTSTAYGMFQFLDRTWACCGVEKTSDPALQTDAGLVYIATRHGSPSSALAFHRRNNWY